MEALLALPISTIASSSCAYPRYGHMMDWEHGSFWYGSVFILIILLALVSIAIYFAVNRNELRQEYKEETTLGILMERYAKGEISKQEFEEMKKDLE